MTLLHTAPNPFRADRPTCSVQKLFVLGTPGTKRLRLFESAVRKFAAVDVVFASYADVVTGHFDVSALNRPDTLVRLDSPAHDDVFDWNCLRNGLPELQPLGLLQVGQFGDVRRQKGEVVSPLQWWFGFRRFLSELASRLPDARWMNPPGDVATMFDKLACERRWRDADLATPEILSEPRRYDDIAQLLVDRDRVFVKHRCGFSATGAVAIHRQGNRIRGLSTMTLDGDRLFLTKQLQHIREESKLAALVDRLGEQGLIAQPWLSKAKLLGRNFDLRVVTVGGMLAHIVGRSSPSPMTNLNLDASRLSSQVLQIKMSELFGDEFWPRLTQFVERAAAAFPQSLYCGLDILVKRSGELSVLEANAFGDYLLRMTWEDRSTHESQIEHLVQAGVLAPRCIDERGGSRVAP